MTTMDALAIERQAVVHATTALLTLVDHGVPKCGHGIPSEIFDAIVTAFVAGHDAVTPEGSLLVARAEAAEKDLHLNRMALAHAAANIGKLLAAEAALRRIAAQVDLTDPRDPVGAAMTRAGCPDVEYGPDDVDALIDPHQEKL